jgi:hypothetical protein
MPRRKRTLSIKRSIRPPRLRVALGTEPRGKCPNDGRQPIKDGIYCRVCLNTSKRSMERAQAKVKGEPVAPLPPKSVAFAETKQRRENDIRLSVLQECLAVYDNPKLCKNFGAWLEGQINKIIGKAAA